MRKPVKRAIRLDQSFDALTKKQMRLYKEALAKLSELVQDLSTTLHKNTTPPENRRK